jgi:hypothetical protein
MSGRPIGTSTAITTGKGVHATIALSDGATCHESRELAKSWTTTIQPARHPSTPQTIAMERCLEMLPNEAVGKLDVRLDPSLFKDSAIIAEVTIVDCRASAEVVFSTSPVANGDTGFSYILNRLRFSCSRMK